MFLTRTFVQERETTWHVHTADERRRVSGIPRDRNVETGLNASRIGGKFDDRLRFGLGAVNIEGKFTFPLEINSSIDARWVFRVAGKSGTIFVSRWPIRSFLAPGIFLDNASATSPFDRDHRREITNRTTEKHESVSSPRGPFPRDPVSLAR